MGSIKDRNGMDLTEAGDIKKRVSLRYQGQAGFRKIRNKLRNVVCSPDISMSYNVITSKHNSENR